MLSWTSFALEVQSSCDYDYVEVFDGPDSSSTSLGRYCGHSLPPSVKPSSNEIIIRKVSDFSITDDGFMFNYEQFGE